VVRRESLRLETWSSRTAWRSFFLLALTWSVITLNCGGEGPRKIASALIGPGGGTVTVDDEANDLKGVSILVPAGAVERTIEVSIASSAQADGTAGPTIHLSPDGVTFNEPAVLAVPFRLDHQGLVAGFSVPAEFLVVEYFNPRSKGWLSLETYVDATSGNVFAPIEHFSDYRLRAKRFASDSTLTYAIRSLPEANLAEGYKRADLERALERAFARWGTIAAEANIKVTRDDRAKSPDIEILAGTRVGAVTCDRKSIGGACKDHTQEGSVRIWLESDGAAAMWAASEPAARLPYLDFETTVLHEIGHAFGLQHTYHLAELLTPKAGPFAFVGRIRENLIRCHAASPVMCWETVLEDGMAVPRRALTQDDIDAFRRLYGLRAEPVGVSGGITTITPSPTATVTPSPRVQTYPNPEEAVIAAAANQFGRPLGDVLFDVEFRNASCIQSHTCASWVETIRGVRLYYVGLSFEFGYLITVSALDGRWRIDQVVQTGPGPGESPMPAGFNRRNSALTTIPPADDSRPVVFGVAGASWIPGVGLRVAMYFENRSPVAVPWTSDAGVRGIELVLPDGRVVPSADVGGRFASDYPAMPSGERWYGWHVFPLEPTSGTVTLRYPGRRPITMNLSR
jgi:hypothetical protein